MLSSVTGGWALRCLATPCGHLQKRGTSHPWPEGAGCWPPRGLFQSCEGRGCLPHCSWSSWVTGWCLKGVEEAKEGG